MGVLSSLEPTGLFTFFEEICSIPHGSYKTGAIADYLIDFAQKRGLKNRKDAAGNVVIFKDATPGYESAPVLMLQGHMDMVCEKDEDCIKDMDTEGLDLFIDGDLIGAKGTTLGGDDGIALAMALAILDSSDIPHGPLECLFTTDEEVGLIGAQAVDTSDLRAKCLLNLDSEKEMVFTVSCAGSIRTEVSLPIARSPYSGSVMSVKIKGLKGGHSGEEIHLGRANANILLGRALNDILKATDMRIISVTGGNKDNAIPRESKAFITVDDPAKASKVINSLAEDLATEYAVTDPNLTITIRPTDSDDVPLDLDSTKRIICYLFCVPNNVQVMSADVKDLVQTSLNLGRISFSENVAMFTHLLRSSVNSQNRELLNKVTLLCETLGGSVNVTSAYSAWEFQQESRLRETAKKAFFAIYGNPPKIEALHAGLECGILSRKIPGLDCLSLGPDLIDIHTTRERLHIESTQRTWRLVLEILKRLK